ncbi:hypothetical protein D3C76_1816330 [compost metagenome]
MACQRLRGGLHIPLPDHERGVLVRASACNGLDEQVPDGLGHSEILCQLPQGRLPQAPVGY